MVSGGTITIHTDVTHRKQLEERIRAGKEAADVEVLRQRDEIGEREKRYRAIVEDQTELISRLDPDLNLTFPNAAYRRMFLSDPMDDSIIGRNILQVIVDEKASAEYAVQIASLTPEDRLLRTILKDLVAGGGVLWPSWIDQALFDDDGNLVGYQSVGRDIKAQKTAEQGLATNSQERQAIVSGALDAIITIDSNCRILEFNPAGELIFGWSGNEVSGLDVGGLIVPELADYFAKVGDCIGFIDYLRNAAMEIFSVSASRLICCGLVARFSRPKLPW